MALPQVDKVGLEGAASGTEIVQTSNASIDLKGGNNEHSSDAEIIKSSAVEGVLLLILVHGSLELGLELLKTLNSYRLEKQSGDVPLLSSA